MAYPSVVTTFSTKANGQIIDASDVNNIQTDVVAIETFVGTQASAAGTLIYDIRATASDGGGHIQSANKGGTGQTAYAKGDVLVASSSSVLSKLTIGSNNQVLTADSNQATGVKWAGVANAEGIQNQQYTYARASVMSGSVYGVKLSENPSILSDGLGLVVKFPAVPASTPMALQVFTGSNGSVSALIKKTDLTNPATTDIIASMIGVLEFDSVSSVFQLININPIKNVNFSTASVFNGDISTAFVDLDLSGVIGANTAVVLLKVTNNSGVVRTYTFRTNGDTTPTASSGSYSGPNIATIKEGSIAGTVLIKTDASGIVEWAASNDNVSTIVNVLSYLK